MKESSPFEHFKAKLDIERRSQYEREKRSNASGALMMTPCSSCEESPKHQKKKIDVGHVEKPELCSIFV